MKVILLLLCFIMLTGCSAPQEPSPPVSPETVPSSVPAPQYQPPADIPQTTLPPDPIQQILDKMTLEDRVGQLFLARCCSSTAVQDISDYHLGGFVLFAQDFEGQTPESVRALLSSYQTAAQIPLLLAVDEEGGTVNRISRYSAFRATPFPSPRSAYAKGGMEYVLTIEEEKTKLLADLGLNLNLGPVCDLADDPAAFLYSRSLGLSAEQTGAYVSSVVRLKKEYHIGSALKHFPGYGNNADTHTGIAIDDRRMEDLAQWDLLPFASGIEAGAGCVLVSHTIVNALDPETPASLSPAVHTYLRQDMNFHGVIMTDDLVMQAITNQYGAGEAAVLAVLAGNDLLCSTEFQTQYQAVLDAVTDGRIEIDTLNNAVRHVLQWKIDLGLIVDPL